MVMPALFNPGRMYSRLIFEGSSGVPRSGWPKTSESSL
jgi:hypothetical protein